MSDLLYICLDATDASVENEVLAGHCEVRMLGATSAAELKDSDLAAADVVAVWHTIWLDEALFARLKKCRAIIRMGVGYDNVDTHAAARAKLPVCNIPDYGTEEVADSAMALTLGLFRGVLCGASKLANGESIRGADAIAAAVPYVKRVRDSVLGLVGLGRIGSAVALRAKACGFDVVFFDPHREDGSDKALGIRRAASLEALLGESDCVSLHCLCNADTFGMMGAKEFGAMRQGTLLVNTARGELIDEAALADALRSGRVAAAALDVHVKEPFARDEGALAGAPNLYCTPHNAWYSPESRHEMRRKGAEAALRALKEPTKSLRNVVNREELLPFLMPSQDAGADASSPEAASGLVDSLRTMAQPLMSQVSTIQDGAKQLGAAMDPRLAARPADKPSPAAAPANKATPKKSGFGPDFTGFFLINKDSEAYQPVES